ncbi:MAG: PEP-CTERM sorting domain-containing protein [Planctomycetes bacterium]|nr:PEP-CTERM sorting domain-containing protein [Planctomycetota bacterium]
MGRLFSIRGGASALFIVACGFAFAATPALAVPFTVATFADPATSSATPLFEMVGDKLSGGWSGAGLTLQTPGLPNIDYTDAKFTMTEITVNMDETTTGGMVSFFASNDDPLFTITFASGEVNGDLGFGAADFVGNDVTITVPGFPFTLFDEAFSFSFANKVTTPNGFTVTAGFTSSATPEPASMTLIAIGAAFVLRRRR